MSKIKTRILSAVFRHLRARPTIESIGIESYRSLLEKSAAAFKPDPSVTYDAFDIHTVSAQWLTPPDAAPDITLMHVHGGGYIAGSIRSHREMASRIAVAAGARLLLFNYRLAPEYPFPAGLNDVKTVYQWLLGHTDAGHDIFIIGDSAGGGLSCALFPFIRRENLRMPDGCILISPWVDLKCTGASHMDNKEKDPMLSQRILKKTARLYTDKDLSDPLISPINHEFGKICPVLIQAGENEVLIDDARRLAEKLKNSGTRAELEIWNGMFHVWHYFAKYLPEGRDAIQSIGNFIRRHKKGGHDSKKRPPLSIRNG